MDSRFTHGMGAGNPSEIASSLTALALATKAPAEEPLTETMFLSSMADDELLSSVSSKASQDLRSLAASIVFQWASIETNTFDELEALVAGVVVGAEDSESEDIDIDPDKLTEEQSEDYEELLDAVGEALSVFSGKDAKAIQMFIDDEDDDALAVEVISAIKEKTKEESSDELIADFSMREALILSAVKKVVRNGKVKLIKKRVRPRRMSGAQRAALKKARSKSNNSAARAKRKKSNRLRARSGLK